MTPDDILIVAPFNLQVRCLRDRLDPRIRIGSVDKFQGQEAPVVIVSLCSSTLEEAPRGASFLLSPNRLNVAVSRAEALAIVVGCPDLMDVRCRSVEEMKLVNLLCHLVQYAEERAATSRRHRCSAWMVGTGAPEGRIENAQRRSRAQFARAPTGAFVSALEEPPFPPSSSEIHATR